jgi:hypothetical protein
MSGYDVIGDIHGQSEKLRGLLSRLDYTEVGGVLRHPHRQAIFVGDLIDRGGGHAEVLDLVKAMVDAGSALAVMGNHELNAIAYATEHPTESGKFLRSRTKKNTRQHEAFLNQISEPERSEWIRWFKTLPLWLDLEDGLRVIHACWHAPSIQRVERALDDPGSDLDAFFVEAATKRTELYKAVEVLLKGPELSLEKYRLPKFLDKGGSPRKRARIRWWRSEATTIRDLAELQDGATDEHGDPYPEVDDQLLDAEDLGYEYREAKPVVYGHYWRTWPPKPGLDWTPTAACVDFSAGAGGPLVAYRWSGEQALDPMSYVAFPPAGESS